MIYMIYIYIANIRHADICIHVPFWSVYYGISHALTKTFYYIDTCAQVNSYEYIGIHE